MNKVKVTKKSIKEGYNKIVNVGYCNLCYLLKYTNPFAYSTRVEGWACDYYLVNNVIISTGYSPLAAKNTNCTYDIVYKYNELAREISCDYTLDYAIKSEKVNKLLNEFIEEISK